MKKIICVVALITIIGVVKGFGQRSDSLRTKHIGYLRSLLNTDSLTLRRVMEVQNNYKQSLKTLLANGQLSDGDKRRGMDSLMKEKNRLLEELLPEEQRNKLIPTTERRRTWKRDAAAHSN